MILHQPMLQVNTPAIVSSVIEIIFPIAMFDVLNLIKDSLTF